MSLTALPPHIGLIDDTGQIPAGDLQKLAGALNEQILHDFARDWHIPASVGVYTPDSLPHGCWAVHIQSQLDQPGALGYHADDQNQPVAYVELTDTMTVTVSHEVLEMLADPWGNRMHQAQPPDSVPELEQHGIGPTDRVSYLLEVGDPCEAKSYDVAGVPLSDYLLPRWYRTAPGRNAWFSHVGYCNRPRQVADGGYVSFARADGNWFQVFNQAGAYQVSDLGPMSGKHKSLREWVDHAARTFRKEHA